jgi:hypothetical protein
MVTVSDDHTIKVWRSNNRCRELGIDVTNLGRSERVGKFERVILQQVQETGSAVEAVVNNVEQMEN